MTAATTPPTRLARPVRWLLVGMVAAGVTAGYAGDILLADWVDEHPLWLIALNPRNRNLVLATAEIESFWPFFVVGFLRLLSTDPAGYVLGWFYGDRAIDWIERRSRTYGPMVRDGQAWFRQWSLPVILVMPNLFICMLAGATRVRPRWFVAANVIGTIARLIVVWQVGEVFSSPVEGIVDFIGRYRTPIIVLSVLAVLWTIFGEFRGNGEVTALREITSDEPIEGDDPPSDRDG